MKIGIGSYAYRWAIGYGDFNPHNPMTPFELLEKATELDVKVVQLCENISLQRYNSKSLRQLRRRAEERGIVLEVGIQEADFSVLRTYLTTAILLGSSLVRVALNAPGKHPTLNESLAIINKLLPVLKAESMTLALENQFHLSSTEMVKLVNTVDNPLVGICLDTANSIGLLEKPLDTVRSLAPYAVSVHLKDYKIVQCSVGYKIVGTPLGAGFLDIESVIDLLKRSAHNPNIILEQWMNRLESEEETLQMEEDWVRGSVKHIKKSLGAGRGRLKKMGVSLKSKKEGSGGKVP